MVETQKGATNHIILTKASQVTTKVKNHHVKAEDGDSEYHLLFAIGPWISNI